VDYVGTVTALDTIAGSPVATVVVPSVAEGYTVGPCEIGDHVTTPAVGDRVVVTPVAPGTAWVVLARLPAL
jgi:hypothetical protein